MSIIYNNVKIAGVGQNGKDGTGFTLFTPIWQDHLVNNASWLRADTFSWQSGTVYVAAYNHLKAETDRLWRQEYGWSDTDKTYTVWTTTTTPAVGTPVYGYVPHQMCGAVTAVSGDTVTISDTISGITKTLTRDTTSDTAALAFEKEVVGGTTIYYLRAEDGHKIVLPDQENNVMAIYNTTGIAWYYILDTTNNRFKLPRNKYGFRGLETTVGSYFKGSVPNFTLVSKTANTVQNGTAPAGSAVYGANNSGGISAGTANFNNTAPIGLNIGTNLAKGSTFGADASEYQDGAAVQSRSVETYLYFFVGNTVEEITTINVGQLTESLNGKADTSLNNIPTNYDYVVESKLPTEDDPTWYRVYKSGWVEQGGVSLNDATRTTVNFLKSYITPPTVVVTEFWNTNGTNQTIINQISVTAFIIYNDHSTKNNCYATWEAKGMGAN